MNFQSNYNLVDHNTFKLNSWARVFVELNHVDEISLIYDFAQAQNIPIRILGGGSNLILPEKIDALVVKNNLLGTRFIGEDSHTMTISCASGMNWHGFVMSTIAQGMFGLENLALIPGTVGGAPIQNVGAYGVEVKQFITRVTGYDFRTNTLRFLGNPECQFEYRHSVFKTPAYRDFLITEVEFKLLKQPQPVLSYAELAQTFGGRGKVTPKEIAQKVIEVRQRKLPDVTAIPNVGSFFKNPIVSAAQVKKLRTQFPDLITHQQPDGQFKLAAGQLIDKLGYRGYRQGGVGMYEKQALVMVNLGQAKADEVQKLADQVRQDCWKKLEVQLEIEPIFW